MRKDVTARWDRYRAASGLTDLIDSVFRKVAAISHGVVQDQIEWQIEWQTALAGAGPRPMSARVGSCFS
jgi:hypothetical protein